MLCQTNKGRKVKTGPVIVFFRRVHFFFVVTKPTSAKVSMSEVNGVVRFNIKEGKGTVFSLKTLNFTFEDCKSSSGGLFVPLLDANTKMPAVLLGPYMKNQFDAKVWDDKNMTLCFSLEEARSNKSVRDFITGLRRVDEQLRAWVVTNRDILFPDFKNRALFGDKAIAGMYRGMTDPRVDKQGDGCFPPQLSLKFKHSVPGRSRIFIEDSGKEPEETKLAILAQEFPKGTIARPMWSITGLYARGGKIEVSTRVMQVRTRPSKLMEVGDVVSDMEAFGYKLPNGDPFADLPTDTIMC